MKKRLLLTVLYLSAWSFITTSYAQNQNGSQPKKTKNSDEKRGVFCIKIDAQYCCDGTNEIPKCITENSTLAIKVYNVNPFITTIGAAGKTSLIDFGNDSLFTFSFTEAPLQKNEVTAPQKDKVNQNLAPTSKPKKSSKDTCCKALESIKQKSKEDALSSIKECNKKISNALEQLTLLNRAEKQLQRLFDTTIITKEDFKKRMCGILECAGISKTCEGKIKKDTCCNCTAHATYKALYDSINAGYECIAKQYKNTTFGTKSAKEFSLSGKLSDKNKGVTVEIKNAKGSFEVEENELEPFFDKITEVVKKATSDSIKNLLLSSAEYIDDCISKLCNYTADEFCQQNFVKGPIEGDYITVSPFAKKINGDTITLKDFPIYKIRICGGHRVNVSTGISFSFFGMTDDDYTIARANTDSQFIIKKTEKGTNLYIPSLTTFIHFYNRGCGSLQSTATMGLSINPTSLESLKVMAGYSLIFGDERRGVFSIGVIAGAVNRLKTKYEKDKPLLFKDYPTLQETDLTAKRFRVGMFLGLSYNLSRQR